MSETHSSEDIRQLLIEQLRQRKGAGELLAAKLLPPLPQREPGQPAPLSFGQQQLWFLSRLVGERPVYNECVTLHLPGPLQRDAFEQSFNEFIRRHEIWRTSFPEQNGLPVQEIHPFEPMELPFVDLRRLPPEEREGEAQRLAAEQARLPFDLAKGPLLRCLLVQLDNELHCLYLTLHHIIFDGVTLYQVFLPELWTHYEAISAGRPSPLPEPTHQYADYALWQQATITQSVLDKQLAYWKEALAGAPALIDLPTDFPRPPAQSFRGGMVPFELSRELTAALKGLAREEGVTLYMLLMASLQVLLYRYTQQEEIVVGAVLGSRDQRPEFASMPGYFLNTLPLACKLTGDLSFREFLQQVREKIIETIEHQDIPFSYLVEQLQIERSPAWNPLFQVALTLEPQLPVLSSGWTITQMDVSAGASKFDLSLEVDDRPDGRLIGRFEYSQDLFEEQTILRLSRHWQTLLSSLVSNPSCSLSSLSLLPPEERHLLLSSFSSSPDPLPPFPAPAIHLLFEAQVLRSPSSCALLQLPSGSSLSYHDLNSQANQLARLLLSLGLS
ncbi:condensation domain-containing protein, partial [Thermogemmatispora sp.]|uniref:condensation domain-containing protein n=1 Tax=Thermogemmatispora sp. TaxID=1968838 RepID=UPI0035E4383D